MQHPPTAETTTAKVAANVDRLRREQGISITALALALGVHRSTMHARLDGTRAWDSDEIAVAARLLDVSADHLLGLDEAAP